MKKTFTKCVNRLFVGALTLLGFAATMTLAACYGPMPEKHYTDGEVADSLASDSLANDVDSSAVSDVDSVAVEAE